MLFLAVPAGLSRTPLFPWSHGPVDALTCISEGATTRPMQGILPVIRHLALVALILRALLPAGWMPDAQAGLTICSVDTLGVIHHDGAPGHTDGKTSQQEC